MNILNPQKTVRVGGVEVIVKDLPWPVMKQFLDRLSHHITGLVGNAVGAAKAGQEARVVGAAFLDQLPSVIANSTELAEYLVLATTKPPTNQQPPTIDQLTSTEFLALLDAALEVVFNEEFVKLGKSVAGRVQAAFNLGPSPARTIAMPTAPSAKPLTSSSGKDGPTRTRVDSPSPNSNSSAQ